MADTLTVPATILEQLGGRRFLVMTGATHLVGSDTTLQFRIPMRTLNGSNTVRITLTAADDYTMEFFSVRGGKVTTKASFEGVYAENLQVLFTKATGLHTSLGTLGRS